MGDTIKNTEMYNHDYYDYHDPSVHKSTKHFSLSFVFDVPKVWNSLILDDVRASPTIGSLRRKLKVYLFSKAYHP